MKILNRDRASCRIIWVKYVDIQQFQLYLHVENQHIPQEPGGAMPGKTDVLQGTLDLMVLKTLEMLGELHGYGIARRIEQVSQDILQLNQGTIYPALVRLQQRRWIKARWGISETGRRARFYSLTPAGRRQIEAEEENWRRTAAVMARFIEVQ